MTYGDSNRRIQSSDGDHLTAEPTPTARRFDPSLGDSRYGYWWLDADGEWEWVRFTESDSESDDLRDPEDRTD